MPDRRLFLVGLFALLVIIGVNLVWWRYYQRTEIMLQRQLDRRLISVALAASASVSPDDLTLLTSDDLTSYLRVWNGFRQIQQADSLAELFLLDDRYRYLVTTLEEADSSYFLLPVNRPWLDSLFFHSDIGPLASPAYRTGNLLLKSAFAPVVDSEGTVLAVVGVEASVDYFDSLGALRRTIWYATLISLAVGLVLGTLLVMVQRRINQTEQQLFLNQSHAFLGRMVAVVAHEIRNPLMIIRGSAERLHKKTTQPEAGSIVEETDRLDQLLTGYLQFAKAEGPLHSGETPEEFDLGELLDGVRQFVEQRIAPEPFGWTTTPLTGPIALFGYRRSLRQVLVNVTVNGAEACQAAGKPADLIVEVHERGEMVSIAIHDRGPGLSRAEMAKLGSPFFTTKISGSGLGLYISRKIVAAMNGHIEIEGEPGTGTTVTITIPKRAKATDGAHTGR